MADYADIYELYDEDGRRLAAHDMPAVRAARGERFANLQINWVLPGGTRTLLMSADTVELPGEPSVAVLTFEDATALDAARARSHALSDAASLLASSLDPDAMPALLARLAVPRLADWCFVEMVRDGVLERVAVEAADPELRAVVRRMVDRYPLDPDAEFGSPVVLRTGEADLQPEIPPAVLEAVAQDAEHLELLRTLGFRSSMIVPLRRAGEVVGDLALVSSTSGRRFGELDLAAAKELADLCGLYLENARLYAELGAARDELGAILAGVGDAVTAEDPDGRLAFANEAAVRLLGGPLGVRDAPSLLAIGTEPIRAALALTDDQGRPVAPGALPGRRILAGETPEALLVRSWDPATGEQRWLRFRARGIRGADGRVIRAITLIEDVTDLKWAEESQRLLAEAGRVLAGALDYEETLRRVAGVAVPALGDWCLVDVLGDRGLERLAVAHARPEDAGIAAELRGGLLESGGEDGPARVARTGVPELRIGPDSRATAGQPPAVRSSASVPMTLRGQRLGVMTLQTTDASGRRLGPEHLAVLEELGRRAAVAVDSARLLAQRSAVARTLQNSLLPPVLPEVRGVETAALYRAAGDGIDVGGDFYDLFTVADDEWFAVVGDVCGKGAEAAAVTALARHTIRAASVRLRSPAAVLEALNDGMRRHGADRFLTSTCVYLRRTDAGLDATVACGGHPAALIRRADGSGEEVGIPGTLLGLIPEPPLADAHVTLGPGDTLVLYTDGITEARAPERVLEVADLEAALRGPGADSAQAIVELLAALAMGKQGTPPRDDIAVLALHVTD